MTVTGITPAIAPNTGPIAITDLAGSGFHAGASVRLTRLGQPDIVATNVVVDSATKVRCRFDITGCAVGQWNVVLTNADGGEAERSLPFEVVPLLVGDVNQDGKVDTLDFAAFLAAWRHYHAVPREAWDADADLDGDGDIDAADAARMTGALIGAGVI